MQFLNNRLNGHSAMFGGQRNNVFDIDLPRRNTLFHRKRCSGAHRLAHGHTGALRANPGKRHPVCRHDPARHG